MKKIWIFGIGIIFVLFSILAYGLIDTGAWFTDSVSSTGNELNAASLKLTVNESRGTRQTYALDNIRPGDWQLGGQANVKNDGTIPGHLWYEIENISPAEGLLGDLVYQKFQANVEPWDHFGGDLVINQSDGTRVDVADLEPGESIPLVVYYRWPLTEQDNDAQGATLTFDVIWHLDQIQQVP
jgi:hypothetical protein